NKSCVRSRRTSAAWSYILCLPHSAIHIVAKSQARSRAAKLDHEVQSAPRAGRVEDALTATRKEQSPCRPGCSKSVMMINLRGPRTAMALVDDFVNGSNLVTGLVVGAGMLIARPVIGPIARPLAKSLI